ncbi:MULTISPECIES: DUF317 domain-containing protein [unclassified Streptomyces]|uniref:DUF317 domain-containing protein n=1 Tax=unclassified Streptomyces TaxID=2593676 RepID=UPI000DC7938F|nr:MULTISPECIES: DUF317 domain-containing protein [unclassified Streptomyces]AWZ07121.1 hypothetical protein DRB89_23655 [Streptomyces sp. ICC4]AWZ17202.1 hypothetical protein DRB96_39340 [Streptomyces sp. ICC1]
MPRRTDDVDLRLALHPDHSSAVVATITAPERYLARAVLAEYGFRPTGDTTMALARIDHDEPHHADKAASALREGGAIVEVSAALQEEIETEWTYGNAPTHWQWLSPEEIREHTGEAQRIHDDILAGRLIIHLHAHDGWTTVAVGTYVGGKSVHLHGEDHLRTEETDYSSEAEAVADFHRRHTVAVRPGPAPLTDIERDTLAVLGAAPSSPTPPAAPSSPAAEETSQLVPVYANGPGDHEALLTDFFATNGEWEKWRPHDETTIASHESLTLRVEFLHEATHGDSAWTIAAYESPVGERLWHATATPATPVEIMRALLNSLSTEDSWGQGPGAPVKEEDLAHASRPLEDTGWPLKVGSRLIEWTAPTAERAGLRFDTLVKQGDVLPAWTIWGGNTADNPSWAIHLSTHAPAALIQDVAFELAHGYSHQPAPLHAASPTGHLAQKPVAASPPAATHRRAPRR